MSEPDKDKPQTSQPEQAKTMQLTVSSHPESSSTKATTKQKYWKEIGDKAQRKVKKKVDIAPLNVRAPQPQLFPQLLPPVESTIKSTKVVRKNIENKSEPPTKKKKDSVEPEGETDDDLGGARSSWIWCFFDKIEGSTHDYVCAVPDCASSKVSMTGNETSHGIRHFRNRHPICYCREMSPKFMKN
jgi:hypothetical protein